LSGAGGTARFSGSRTGRWSGGSGNGGNWHGGGGHGHGHHGHGHGYYYSGFYPYWYGGFYPYWYDYPYYGASLYYDGYYNGGYGYEDGRVYNGRVANEEGGSGHSIVSSVQEQLAQNGFYHGPIDGVIGNQTRNAIRQYERRNGLPEDGRIDNDLLNSLGVR